MKGFLICVISFVFFSFFPVYAKDIKFKEDIITVGGCKVRVLVAETPREKASGMLGFTDATFPKDGMIFLGVTPQNHFYHTVGMMMDIRIMGVNLTGHKTYEVNGGAVYAPSGKRSITIFGDSVFEVPEDLYQSELKDCLFKKESSNGR